MVEKKPLALRDLAGCLAARAVIVDDEEEKNPVSVASELLDVGSEGKRRTLVLGMEAVGDEKSVYPSCSSTLGSKDGGSW